MHKPKIQETIIPQIEQAHLLALVFFWCNEASTILGVTAEESSLWILLSEPAGAAERDSLFSVLEMVSTICSIYFDSELQSDV